MYKMMTGCNIKCEMNVECNFFFCLIRFRLLDLFPPRILLALLRQKLLDIVDI